MISRALLSVSDKTGIVEFARFLADKKIEILSTGGTAKELRAANIPVRDVSDFTGFPEIFDGRVKTLHPKIHGGLLYRRDEKKHVQMAEEQGIQPIDLVVVNLYPFEQTVTRAGISDSEAIEQIDIGGPSMLRSAAKNHASVTVLTDPDDYALVQAEMEKAGDTTAATRRLLAAKVFARTAEYDAAIARYFDPNFWSISGRKIQDLRYGENPHQTAAFYRSPHPASPSIATAQQLQGKELSFNNILDANAALSIVSEFDPKAPVATIIKHLNPCGTAFGKTPEEAFQKAYQADSLAAFGGIVALNQEVSAELAEKMSAVFFEIIVAPGFSKEAQKILSKKENLRLLEVGKIRLAAKETDVRSVLGGYLVQDLDTKALFSDDLKVVTKKAPNSTQTEDLLFAWKVCRHVKSNAIVLAKGGVTVGVGAGQMSRVDSVEIALKKAGEKADGAVCASDAFFPFADSIELLAKAGVTAIIQPGGSKKDQEVIDACDKLGIAMIFTGTRAFRH